MTQGTSDYIADDNAAYLDKELDELAAAVNGVAEDYLAYADWARTEEEVLMFEKLRAVQLILMSENASLILGIARVLAGGRSVQNNVIDHIDKLHEYQK